MDMQNQNTLQKGSVRYVVFQEQNAWYAAALEFNIVVSGDDPQEVLILLLQAINGYVKSARKAKAQPHILNQIPEPEYERLWKANEILRQSTQEKKPVNIYSSGRVTIPV